MADRDVPQLPAWCFQPDEETPALHLLCETVEQRAAIMRLLGAPAAFQVAPAGQAQCEDSFGYQRWTGASCRRCGYETAACTCVSGFASLPATTQFREHRGTLAASMETARLVADRPALVALLAQLLAPRALEVKPDMVQVRPYGRDDLTGWDAHIVTIEGYGVAGFTDGPL